MAVDVPPEVAEVDEEDEPGAGGGSDSLPLLLLSRDLFLDVPVKRCMLLKGSCDEEASNEGTSGMTRALLTDGNQLTGCCED